MLTSLCQSAFITMQTFLETKRYSTLKVGLILVYCILDILLTQMETSYLLMNFEGSKDPAVRIDFLLYEGIMRSIKDFQKDTGIELTDSYKTIDTKVWSIDQHGNKHVQYVLSASAVAPTALRKWDERFNDQNGKIYLHCVSNPPLVCSSDGYRRDCYTVYSQPTDAPNQHIFKILLIVPCVLFAAGRKKPFGSYCGTVIYHRCFGMG